MAKSTRLTKSLTASQMDFLKQLDEEEIQLFTINSMKEAMPEVENLNEIVENLLSKGFLQRLERGKYCRTTFHDENVTGTFIATDGVIAYWSALHLHGLTEQFPNTVFVQTTRKKSPVSIFGTSYRFVKINPPKRIGIIYNGHGNYKYPVTDIEKTLADCFDLPQYSGGYAELVRAFFQVELNAEKLIDYCIAMNNISVIKRMGFLAELSGKNDLRPFIEFARTRINRTYNLFDPFGADSGEPETTWHLRMNLSMETIQGIIHNQY